MAWPCLQFLRSCKQGVRIVNVARGGLLDYDAVKAALEAQQIGGLGLDVQWQEPVDPEDYFATHPKCGSGPPPIAFNPLASSPQYCGFRVLEFRARAQSHGALKS